MDSLKRPHRRLQHEAEHEGEHDPRSPARGTTLRDCLLIEEVRFAADLYGAFPVKRLFLGFAHSSLECPGLRRMDSGQPAGAGIAWDLAFNWPFKPSSVRKLSM
jgi:hypothetical protein